MRSRLRSSLHLFVLVAAFIATTAVYWPGLYGGYLFDDYPNIVDNHGVQPHDASLASLVNAALSSPATEFKRPLASLSFAANYLATGPAPYWMKLSNLVIHLLNGLLVFLLARALLCSAPVGAHPVRESSTSIEDRSRTGCAPTGRHAGLVAALIAAGWMLLPINLTGVLYVVQRMESMANLFVLFGLIGYVAGRRRMLAASSVENAANPGESVQGGASTGTRGFVLCALSITVPTALGILAKETAVMLPLYALLIEWALFQFRKAPCRDSSGDQLPDEVVGPQSSPALSADNAPDAGVSRLKSLRHVPIADSGRRDRRIITLFLLVLVLPMVLGLAWLLPGILTPETWATRDFTLGTRLLSEARIVVDYIVWTLLPTPHALSFYHDNFHISTGLLTPWTTLASIVLLAALITLMFWLRRRQPLVALGIALFLGCQLLTGTIIPLELIYEHRNYFASFGLLLAVIPLLAAPPRCSADPAHVGAAPARSAVTTLPMALPRYVLLAGLLLSWTALTAMTAYAWGNPLRLAEDLAARAPLSPRAEYELGRTYIIYSHYDPTSPFTKLAYAPLEKAAALPDASILPEQALIFMNARMHLPLKDAWWNSMIAKLKARKPGVQDESSLVALTQCAHEHRCDLPKGRMVQAFLAALSHPDPNARLLATYGDYAWNVLNDHALGERMTQAAVKTSPDEPAYQITLIRMLAAEHREADADAALRRLETLNLGGRLDSNLHELRSTIAAPRAPTGSSGLP